jgi:hypothetical protein
VDVRDLLHWIRHWVWNEFLDCGHLLLNHRPVNWIGNVHSNFVLDRVWYRPVNRYGPRGVHGNFHDLLDGIRHWSIDGYFNEVLNGVRHWPVDGDVHLAPHGIGNWPVNWNRSRSVHRNGHGVLDWVRNRAINGDGHVPLDRVRTGDCLFNRNRHGPIVGNCNSAFDGVRNRPINAHGARARNRHHRFVKDWNRPFDVGL